MDSHESSENFIKTTAVETVPIQDSPIFSNIANLSPAQPFNVPPRTHSLIRLNCPRQLFMSPQARAPHRTSLVRTNYPELSGATISAQDEGCNYSLPFVSGSKNDRIEHSSADPDKFLANILNMDFLDPNNSSSFAIKQSEHIDQPPDDVSGKKIVLKLGHKYNTRLKEETATFAPHAFINQDPEDSMTEHHGMHRSYLQFEDAQHKLKPDWHSEIHLDGEVARSLSLTRQQDAFNTIQSISYPERYLNPTPTMSITKPSSSGLDKLKTNWHSQINLEWEGPGSLVWTRQKTPINTIQPISYPGRYLNPTPTMGITEPSSSGLQKLKTNWHPQIHLDGEWARSLSLARKQTPSNTIQPISYPKQYLNPTPTMSITKPSSSGLHLNNLFNSGATMNVKSAPMGSFSVQGRKSKPLFNSVAKSLLRESTLLSAYLTNSSNKSIVLNPRKDQSTQGGKNKRNSENVGDEEEFYRSSPKKERKRISESSHGAIRCQCKKIKCVKLYCDCFAAGFYCVETCSCQGCLNLKTYDDEVLEARELIESRNPLAFAPKVVQHSIKPSASGHGEDGTRLTPSSARHIRGCNCKKSMCLKRYCECYQSKVGCSDGCNCEGCRNVYGQKEGIMKDPMSEEKHNQRTDSPIEGIMKDTMSEEKHNQRTDSPIEVIMKDSMSEEKHNQRTDSPIKGIMKDPMSEEKHNQRTDSPIKGIMKDPLSEEKHNQRTDSSFFDSFDMVAPRNDNHGPDLGTDQSSTPLSPPFFYRNEEEDVPKFWSSLEKYFLWPDLHLLLDNNGGVSETAKRILGQLSFNQEPDLGNAGDEFKFPIPLHKPDKTGTSSGLPNYKEWTNSSAPGFPSGSSHYPCASSQNWSGSPISPVIDFRGTKLDQVVASARELLNVLEDNRPEMLADPPMSLNVVKVSSQNKKRVSPPHDPVQEFGSSSPVGSLKSAPSTPVQQMKDPQDRGGNK